MINYFILLFHLFGSVNSKNTSDFDSGENGTKIYAQMKFERFPTFRKIKITIGALTVIKNSWN